MKAVIMAGGRGTRLAPYTTVLPKPLMPLSDRPILDVILRQLSALELDSVHISVGHMGSLIENWVRSQSGYGMPIHFVYEEEPLGTAGALGLIEDLGETFLAMNGDILTTLDFAALATSHAEHGATATVAVKQREVNVEYGVVHLDPNGHIERLEEKPRLEYTVSMGVYAFTPGILRHIERGAHADFPDVLARAMAAGDTVAAFPFDGYWRDIGNHDDYAAAISEFEADPGLFLPA